MIEYALLIRLVFIVGRILYGGYFVYAGVRHFKNLEMMTGYAGSRGVPYPKYAVAISGLMIIVGGLGVLFGVYPEYALLLIILFLIPVTLKMHNFWIDTDPNTRMGNKINFEKNTALLGAALMLYAMPTPWILPLYSQWVVF